MLHLNNYSFIGKNRIFIFFLISIRVKIADLSVRKNKTMLQKYSEYYASVWQSCSSQVPTFEKNYPEKEKLKKEEKLDQYVKMIQSIRGKNHQIKKVEFDENKFFQNTRTLFAEGFGFEEGELDLMFSDELIRVTKSFVRQAHEFDSELRFPEIYQACRNVWIMNGLQLILGLPIQLTPSIFAYSLLYPYTDNFIDDPQVSPLEKWQFSQRFRDRLSGTLIKPANRTEEAIWRLVGLIESQYVRTDSPGVFQSLLDIHEAQTNSLKLIQSAGTLSGEEILKICMEKGGASVLADGFLVAGNLSEEQKLFFFGYGAYLQLLDDVQDVEEDKESGLMTIFSKLAGFEALDEKLVKTFLLGVEVMKSLSAAGSSYVSQFRTMMRKSTDLFIAEAIAQHANFFSSDFVHLYETASPFHFSYIRKRKESFTSYHGFLLTALEEVAFAENSLVQAV